MCCFFFFNDTATTEIYTLSLHDALPIYPLPMLIVERQTDEGVRFDLFVLGLDTIAGVAEVALTLEQSGMAPVIVPLVRH